MNFAAHTSLITLTFSPGWCGFPLIWNYRAPQGGPGGCLNNGPGHRSPRDTVAGHMGSGARGQGVGGRRVVGTGKPPEWPQQEIELLGDALIGQPPHCTDAFTPVSISHFTPGLLPDRMCSASSFYPQISQSAATSQRGYGVCYLSPPSPLFANPPPSPASPPVSLPAQQQHGVITDKQSILH